MTLPADGSLLSGGEYQWPQIRGAGAVREVGARAGLQPEVGDAFNSGKTMQDVRRVHAP